MDDMIMDDMIEVQFVGGPVDGGTMPVPREAVEDAPRVLYTAEPGGDPAVWHWRGWVP